MKNVALYLILISFFISSWNISSLADSTFEFKKNEFKKLKRKKVEITEIKFKEDLYKSPADIELDELIEKSFGKEFKRANIYEIYPLNLDKKKFKHLKEKERIELANYYDYARSQLEEFSGAKLLRFIKLNFDGDKEYDYAVVIHNTSHKTNHLAIFNSSKTLFFEDFNPGYIEAIQRGTFPVEILIEGKIYKFYSPVIRHIAFDAEDRYLSYNRTKNEWIIIETKI